MALTKTEAQDLTCRFVRDYPGALALAYRLRQNTAELYDSRADKVPASMKGGYVPKETTHNGRTYQGRIDIPLENLRDPRDLMVTLRHEVLGHYGANTFAPDEKRALLDGLVAARNEPGIKPLWESIDRRYSDRSLDVRAEEVFALHCEGLAPIHHVNDAQAAERGQQSFLETCIDRTRLVQAADLNSIACMVAQGLHDRTRTQQTFPQINELFRRDNTTEPKKPFHEVVAEKLIEQLKAGVAPWQKPWQPGEPNSLMPMNPTTGKRYKGINAIHLMAQGRDDSRWMTYKQAAAAGAQVRKGEKGTPVQYFRFSEEQDKLDDQGRPVRDANGDKIKETVPLERPRVFFATVFNAGQIDGLPPPQIKPKAEQQWDAVERAEHILQASGAKITHAAGDRAFYRPSTDSITLPEKSQFQSADRYYATALHELGHWTGHPARLDRDLAHPFGSDGYAKEELRAEIASIIVGEELNIGHDPGQHAAYVKSWIKVLEDDPLEIFRASSDAEKIHKYVLAFEQVQEQEKELAMQPTNIEMPNDQDLQNRIAERLSAQQKAGREYINVPYGEKEKAKGLGARWDRQHQSWYVPPSVDTAPFAQWAQGAATAAAEPQAAQQATQGQEQAQKPAQARQYLAVPYSERSEAKAAGARWDKAAKSWYAGPRADMAKLGRWNPDNVSAQQGPAMTPREEFAQAMRRAGLFVGHRPDGDHPIMDGKKHRVPVNGGKSGTLDGFYVGHLDGRPAGRIINNKTGTDITWKRKGYALSGEEKAKLQAEAATKLAEREAAQEQAHEATALRVGRQMATLAPIEQPTPYLQLKGIKVQAGVLSDKDGQKTYIPVFDAGGKQWAMQYIQEDGTKRFAKDSKKEGCFHPVGGIEAVAAAPALVIAEGYATAATLAEALQHGTVAAFDSGNLTAVARALHEKFPAKPVVILGDNDRYQEITQGRNHGKSKAQAAAQVVGGKAVLPVFAPGEADYPVGLDPVTPQSYRAHLHATRALETTTDPDRKAELEKALLTKEQQTALARIKRYTDFNDLATQSRLGREGVERQVRATVNKAVAEAKQKQQQGQRQTYQQEQKQRRTRHAVNM